MAALLARMQPIGEDMVRGIAVRHVLHGFGAALRLHPSQQEKTLRRLHQKSRPIDAVAEFWSHSWRGEAWQKISTLSLLKNGTAAAIIGTLAACLGSALSFYGVLPLFGTAPLWGNIFGTCFFIPTILLWPSSQKIFLDVACIDQEDPKKKAKGILSLGATLKRSKKFLLLWDPSYDKRLWCIFELAAFVRCNPENNSRIRIMPIFLGTCAFSLFTWCLVCTAVSVGIQAASWNFDYENDEEYYEKYYFGIAMYYVFISVWFVSFTYIACMMFRKHFRSIASFQERLLRFQLAEAECYCCSAGHVDTGDLCDREVIARCIRAWFGSESEFEEVCRTVLGASILRHLGPHLFPYKLYMVSSCPLLWGIFDHAVFHWLVLQTPRGAVHYLMVGFANYMGLGLLILSILCFIARCCWRPLRYKCVDHVLNVVAAIFLYVVFFATVGFIQVLYFLTNNDHTAENLVALPSSWVTSVGSSHTFGDIKMDTETTFNLSGEIERTKKPVILGERFGARHDAFPTSLRRCCLNHQMLPDTVDSGGGKFGDQNLKLVKVDHEAPGLSV
eukprot:symbB.v1.2.004487.t1/scaffold254.1/size251309/10